MNITYTEIDFVSFLKIKLGLRDSTIERNLGLIRRVFEFMHTQRLTFTSEHIERYLLSGKNRGLSNGTLNNQMGALKILHAYFKDRGIQTEDFLLGFRRLKKTRKLIDVLSIDEVSKILSTKLVCQKYGDLSDKPLEQTYQTLTCLLALTGCRSGEAIGLRVKYINLTKKTVSFVDTKNGEDRTVHITEPLLTQLNNEITGKKMSDLVFTNKANNPILRQNYSVYLKRLAILAGITDKEVYPHLFRHSFITTMLENNISLSKVKAIVGHKDIKSTDYYTHLADDSVRRAMLHHPLIRQGIDVGEVLDDMQEAIKQFKLNDDKRFTYELSVSGSSLQFTVNLRKGGEHEKRN